MKTLTEKKEWIQYAPEIGDEIDENYRTITVKNGIGFHLTGRISEADAKLMAAAPDLLEALTDVLTELKQGFKPYGAVHESLIKNIESAIKKAIE